MKQFLVNSYLRLKETNIFSNFVNLSSIQLSNILLLMLLYPIITRIIGIEAFGVVILANTFASLAAIIINYGTNQSGVRDVAINLNHKEKLRSVFYTALWIRVFLFVLYLLFLFALKAFSIRYYTYILLALPLVLAEVLNPLFFFLGIEKLKYYNIANLVSKAASIIILIFFIKGPEDSEWVNFIIGSASSLAYLYLFFLAISQFKLSFQLPIKSDLLQTGKENFYLTVNNISVHLQQSLMVFALAKWGSPAWLGAYSLCDKVIGSCRILIITAFNAIYPKSVQIYTEGPRIWKMYHRRMQIIIAGLFFIGSSILFLFAGPIIHLLSGENNEIAIIFLRTMAIVPTIAALNSLNVLDQLLKNNNVYIFRVAMILLIIALLLVFILFKSGYYYLFGTFTLFIELSALLMYQYIVQKPALAHA